MKRYLILTLKSLLFIFLFSIIFFYFSAYKKYVVPCGYFLDSSELKWWRDKNESFLLDESNEILSFEYDYQTCPWKVGLIIYFETNKQRSRIMKKIWSYFFFNWITYTLKNV